MREYRRLEAALAALDSPAASDQAGARRQMRSRTAAGGVRRAAGPRKRAPRGANREAVLRLVAERPGITTSELVASSGVERRTFYTLLSTLTKHGAVERQKLPGGHTGYRRGAETAQASAAATK